jgi:hypothetical protein
MTEEDMTKVTPELEGELLNAMAKGQKYRLVAEVVSSNIVRRDCRWDSVT